MSEPSSNVPGEVADAQVDETTPEAPRGEDKVELHLDEDKVEAWDDVKADYQVDPDAEDTPPGADEEGMTEANGLG
jgi:hypothetical protein